MRERAFKGLKHICEGSKMPKVSIVMPVYNGEAYIKAAIDSIIAQTFTDWEFIIINEYGSNEAVTQILREYEEQDNRIHVIQNETRLRIAESLNVGLRAAKGEYIARMDADDISGKDRLLNQVQYLDEHQEIDICGMKVDMFGETTWDWKVYSDPKYLRCSCLFYTPFIHPTIMMRTSSIRKYNLEYDKTFFYTEDYEFFERASHVLNYTNLEIPQNYHYRYLSTNATNVGGNQGLQLQNKVMKSAFQRWGLEFTDDEIRILSPNTYPYAQSVEQAQDILERLDLLLKEVFLSDALREKFGIDILYQVLHRRWMDAYEAVRWRSEIMDDGQMQRAIDRGFFKREKFYTPIKASVAPRVSVVIPTYNSERYVMDTLWSILEQDYTQFEVLIMNEYGSDDRTRKCVELFGDGRVQFIQNETKLGLAKSLNLGFRMAKGEYIARADADDIYSTDRLSKQVEFLDAHPEIDVCGTWQRHFGKRNYIHKPVTSKEEMRVNLIFKCDVCHSTVMLRRDKFVSLDVIYDDSYLSEDFELWSRVSPSMWFATIPEVLGEYRWNGNNITAQKMDMLDIEAQKLVRRNLYNTLGLVIPDEDLVLLSGWKNPFMDETKDVEQLRSREEELLTKIEKRNHEIGALDEKALSNFLYERKVWAGIQKEHMFRRTASSCEPKQNTGGVWRKMLKRIIKPLYRPFRTRYENRLIGIQESVWRHDGVLDGIEKTLHDMDGHLYDYHHKLELKIEQQGAYIDQLQALIKGMTEELKSIRNQIVASENTVVQAMDGRIWQAEKLINQTTDTRVWNAEKLINQTTDGRIWQAEQNTVNRISKFECEAHRHIDFTYRDIMVAMERQKPFLPTNDVKLITEYPIAYESLDHLYPHGTIRDNTRYPRFVEKCEEILGNKSELSFLDLGCSGGGMVLEAALRGHTAMGLEGSDSSKKEQRAEWRLLGERLKTCDITKPFRLENLDGEVKKFDIITAWEVMEHIQETDLPQMLENIRNHLSDTGYFVASIANWEDIDPESGVNWHVTLHEYKWWVQQFQKAGFKTNCQLFQPIDMARGTYNPPHCYETPYQEYNSEKNFYIVAYLEK